MKTFTMKRLKEKETPGCHRYGFVSGDAGVSTIYLRKEHLSGTAPDKIEVTITETDF